MIVAYITTVVQSHLSWMEKVYPHVVTNSATAPLECMQNEGDIMYVPEGWYHATINIGDTHSIAQRTENFNDKTSRGLGQQAIRAIMKYRFAIWLTAWLALAVKLDVVLSGVMGAPR